MKSVRLLPVLLLSFSVLLTTGNNHANPNAPTKTPAHKAGVLQNVSA
jgi:hypothetical protein